jgi:hypothetical protein
MRPKSVTDPPLDLDEVTRAVVLLQRLLGPVSVSVSVEHDRVTIPPALGSSTVARVQRCLTVQLHCRDDEVAAEVGNRLGLGDGPSRTFPAAYTDAMFVESRWAGWLTPPDAASLEVPVSLTVFGSHLEPALLDDGDEVLDEAVA